jgi:hypothetical protein
MKGMNTMKKQLYFLKINPALQSVMPPLQNNELELLTQRLLAEGCREPLVIWNGMVVDGHTRYRICHASVERVLLPIEDQRERLPITSRDNVAEKERRWNHHGEEAVRAEH